MKKWIPYLIKKVIYPIFAALGVVFVAWMIFAINDDEPPADDACKNVDHIKNLSFTQIATFADNYFDSRGLGSSGLYRYNSDSFPVASNFDECTLKLMMEANALFQSKLKDYGGTGVYYGLKDKKFSTEKTIRENRWIMFFPLKANGQKYDAKTLNSEIGKKFIAVKKLKEDFHDPCPPLCDY